MRMPLALALGASLWLVGTPPARAAQLEGVTMADAASTSGHALKLNGMGLRTKLVFKVYVGGLYLESPSHDASAVLSQDQVRQMRLQMMMGLSGAKIASAIREGFELNSHSRMPQLEARLKKLEAMFPELVKGDVITLTYLPGTGTVVSAKGQTRGTVEGKDFADALFAVWIGARPVDEKLKAGLLGH